MSSFSLTHNQITELFQHHRDSILAFLVNRVRCAETAKDLSQETYLRLICKSEIAHDENLSAYLFRIADRLAIDHLRQARLPRNNAEPLDAELPCPQRLPDEISDLRQQCERLLNAIETMPKRCRNVFLLRKFDELSYGEIAAHLGISEKTVQRHLIKAMLHCHRYLSDC